MYSFINDITDVTTDISKNFKGSEHNAYFFEPNNIQKIKYLYRERVIHESFRDKNHYGDGARALELFSALELLKILVDKCGMSSNSVFLDTNSLNGILSLTALACTPLLASLAYCSNRTYYECALLNYQSFVEKNVFESNTQIDCLHSLSDKEQKTNGAAFAYITGEEFTRTGFLQGATHIMASDFSMTRQGATELAKAFVKTPSARVYITSHPDVDIEVFTNLSKQSNNIFYITKASVLNVRLTNKTCRTLHIFLRQSLGMNLGIHRSRDRAVAANLLGHRPGARLPDDAVGVHAKGSAVFSSVQTLLRFAIMPLNFQYLNLFSKMEKRYRKHFWLLCDNCKKNKINLN